MFLIFVSDWAVAFSALFLMLYLRYGAEEFGKKLDTHIVPFIIIIALFTLLFYIFSLYSLRLNRSAADFISSFIKSLIVAFFVSIFIFYIFGDFFKLTPKTNLVIFTGIFGISNFYIRILIKRYLSQTKINSKILLITTEQDELIKELIQNQNIGYEIIKTANTLNADEAVSLNPDIVVMSNDQNIDLYQIQTIQKASIAIYSANKFYEEVLQKIPFEKLNKNEVVSYLSQDKTIFNILKRTLDIILSLVMISILSPLFLIIAILVKITSRGPIWIRQERITKNGAVFVLYKFRSMIATSLGGQSEENGAVWATNDQVDPRVTRIGGILKRTHLDEFPQLFNILRGDISFVGPRPERPEFMDMLKSNILYYDLRHSIKAGLTGWAQVNYKYGSSVEDTKEKLKYDFYYIKNRNIFFDILIILKTIAKIFTY